MSEYQRKPRRVEALQLKKPVSMNGFKGKRGDYLVIEGNNQFIMEKEEFEKEFEKPYQPLTWTYYPIGAGASGGSTWYPITTGMQVSDNVLYDDIEVGYSCFGGENTMGVDPHSVHSNIISNNTYVSKG